MDLFLILIVIATLVAIALSVPEYRERAKESGTRPWNLAFMIISILVATGLAIVDNRSNQRDVIGLNGKLNSLETQLSGAKESRDDTQNKLSSVQDELAAANESLSAARNELAQLTAGEQQKVRVQDDTFQKWLAGPRLNLVFSSTEYYADAQLRGSYEIYASKLDSGQTSVRVSYQTHCLPNYSLSTDIVSGSFRLMIGSQQVVDIPTKCGGDGYDTPPTKATYYLTPQEIELFEPKSVELLVDIQGQR